MLGSIGKYSQDNRVCEISGTYWYSFIWYMSQVTYGNPPTSAVIHRRFLWKSVQKFVDCLWRAHGIIFWDPQNRLSGVHRIVFWAPADSSYGSPPNDLWETAGYRLRAISLGVLKSLCDLLRAFCGNPPQVRMEVPWIPSNVSAYNLQWFRGWFTEVCKLPRRNLRKPTRQIRGIL